MANYYYVKNGGSKTSGSLAKQTGSFATLGAANYYDSIKDAFAAVPAAGDFILVSSSHSKSYGAATTFAVVGGVFVVCVSDSNCDQESTGAAEDTSGGAYNFNYQSIVSRGVNFTSGASQTATSAGRWNLSNCDVVINNNSTGTFGYADSKYEFYNVNLSSVGNGLSSTAFLATGQQTFITMVGGSILPVATTTQALIRAYIGGGVFEGVDLSTFNTLVTTGTTHYNTNITFKNCKTKSGATKFSGSWSAGAATNATAVRYILTDSADGLIQLDEYRPYGEIHTDTNKYITSDGDKYSYDYSFRITTSAQYMLDSSGMFLRVPILSGVANTATQKTITVPICQTSDVSSPTALKDNEVWVEVVHQDDASTLAWVENDRAADTLNGTNQAIDSTTSWTNDDTYITKQSLAKTTSNTGKNGPYTVYVCLAKPSTTIYVGKPVIS